MLHLPLICFVFILYEGNSIVNVTELEKNGLQGQGKNYGTEGNRDPNGSYSGHEWWAEDVIVRTTNRPITIPYNPLILQKKTKKIIGLKPPKKKVDWRKKALFYRKLINEGYYKNQADIARKEGISETRVSHIMKLLK